MTVTIYSIAKQIGTSSATVSRALNGHPRISEDTRQRVLRAAKDMGYRTNFAGRYLKTGKTETIGLILPDLANPYYIEFLRHVETNCLDRGYKLVTMEYMKDASRERTCLEQMLERHCDGFITSLTMLDPVRDLVEDFYAKHIPCVVAGLPGDVGESHVDGTVMDISCAMEEAVDHLIEFGHRNIVFAASLRPDFPLSPRMMGIQRAFEKHGLSLDERNVISIYSGDYVADGRAATDIILNERKETTAIIAFNDLLASGVYKALHDRGYQIPNDFSLIGVDNTWLSRTLPVSLTTIDQKVAEGAEAVTEILFTRLGQKDWSEVMRRSLRPSLVIRESTGPVRTTPLT